MASYGQSAPILEYSGEAGQLVDDPEFNLSVENSQSLIKKVLEAIPATHTSCIHSEVSGSASAKPLTLLLPVAGCTRQYRLCICGESELYRPNTIRCIIILHITGNVYLIAYTSLE